MSEDLDSPKPKNFVCTIDLELAPKLRADLEQQGCDLAQPAHTLFQARKKGFSCTLYQSGKLVVQGSNIQEFIEFYLEPEITQNFSFSYSNTQVDRTARIGIDEAGKGDFFGPLCVGGLYASGSDVDKLVKMGVKDSKNMKDPEILKLATAIRKEFAYEVITIFPMKYNELYSKFKNLNHLLAWGHAHAIECLVNKTQCRHAIIDQFASEWVVANALKKKHLEIDLVQRTKGEEDVVVAGASILARAAFVNGIAKLGETMGTVLPKGASKKVLEAGRRLAQQHGPGVLNQLGKLHFKTYRQILGEE